MYYYLNEYRICRSATAIASDDVGHLADHLDFSTNEWERHFFSHSVDGPFVCEGTLVEVFSQLNLEIQLARSMKDIERCGRLQFILGKLAKAL